MKLETKVKTKGEIDAMRAAGSGAQGTVVERDQRLIDECMDWFDFEKVHRVMAHTGWEWAVSGGVPSVPEMRESARRYLREAVLGGVKYAEEGTYGFRTGSGGFMAHYRTYTEDESTLHLTFELESWDAGDH